MEQNVMFHILIDTILPIFSLIILGLLLHLKGVIDPGFARTANQIVFNVAIPAMLFTEISQVPFRANFSFDAVVCILSALGIICLIGLLLTWVLRIPRSRRGTFLQSSFHGNIGYMSYAIAYYALGESHFARMAILSSFLMLAQNILAVGALAGFSNKPPRENQRWLLWKLIFQNPIILTVAAGITYSALAFPLPIPLKKSLEILSGMAFPTALLLIGASLSFGAFRLLIKEIVGIGVLKLVGLPLLGYALMSWRHLPPGLVLPGIILLAAPPATVTYVMATELGGDPELAATSISIHTLLSAFTYTMVLSAFAG
jgi:malate permease and related proteins